MQEGLLKELLYFLFVCITFNTEGGHFVLMPTVFAKLFGPTEGIRVFSVGFTFMGLANLLNILVITEFFDHTGVLELGFSGICYIYAVLGLVSLLMLYFFEEKKVVLRI